MCLPEYLPLYVNKEKSYCWKAYNLCENNTNTIITFQKRVKGGYHSTFSYISYLIVKCYCQWYMYIQLENINLSQSFRFSSWSVNRHSRLEPTITRDLSRNSKNRLNSIRE